MTKTEESALRFGDCADICLIVEGTNDCLHCYWTDEAGPFFDITQISFHKPKDD